MGKIKARKLTRDEKEAVSKVELIVSEWLFLKESEVDGDFIIVHKEHPTKTKRIHRRKY